MDTINLKDIILRICGKSAPFIIFENGWVKKENNKYEFCGTIYNFIDKPFRELLKIITQTSLTVPSDLEIVHVFTGEKTIIKSFEMNECNFGGPGAVKFQMVGICKVENKIIQYTVNTKEYDFSNLILD